MPLQRRRIALTRAVSPRLSECELTHLERAPIDIARARAQHDAYRTALSRMGCEVSAVAEAPDLPDGVFVEDPAVVFDEVAIIARSSAVSRRAETPSVETALRAYRPIERIVSPATIDGGDVLRIGRSVLVGLSPRTNAAAVDQMRRMLEPFGYRVTGVTVTGCLHLKSACTAVAPGLIVANREWIDTDTLRSATEARILDVDPAEPRGANHLLVGRSVLSPASCPRTTDCIRGHDVEVHVVDVSALEQAESGVTCSSLIFEAE